MFAGPINGHVRWKPARAPALVLRLLALLDPWIGQPQLIFKFDDNDDPSLSSVSGWL
jgi:hypothetical protein